MNGKSEEELIDSILDQIERATSRQQKETDALMACLLDCVRELSRLRRHGLVEADEAGGKILMGRPERRARHALAPHLRGVSDAQRDAFRSGKLDPEGVELGVSGPSLA